MWTEGRLLHIDAIAAHECNVGATHQLLLQGFANGVDQAQLAAHEGSAAQAEAAFHARAAGAIAGGSTGCSE